MSNSNEKQKKSKFKSIFKSPLFSKKSHKTQSFGKKIPKQFHVVNEIDEDLKNISEDDNTSNNEYDKSILQRNSNIKGILALTEENLRKLELKNQVNFI